MALKLHRWVEILDITKEIWGPDKVKHKPISYNLCHRETKVIGYLNATLEHELSQLQNSALYKRTIRNKTERERDQLNIFRAKSVLEKILERLSRKHIS